MVVVRRRAKAFLGAVDTIADTLGNRMFADMYRTALRDKVERGEDTLFRFLGQLERTPVSIEEFIDGPEFLGATDFRLWPEVRRTVVEINCNWWKGLEAGAKNEAVLMGACVDAATEFLTPTGWKPISEYRRGDTVGQYHADGSVTFVEPQRYVKYRADHFLHFNPRGGVDMALTEGHRVIYRHHKTGEILEISAEDLAEKQRTLACGFKGKFIGTFSVAGRPGILLSDAEIRVMVMVHADGSFYEDTEWCNVIVKKERKVARAHELLLAAGVPYTYVTCRDGYTRFRFYAPERNKTYAGWMRCTESQLRVVAEEVMKWDGSDRHSQFYTAKKEEADFIQYALAATGTRATMQWQSRGGNRQTEYRVKACVNDTTSLVNSGNCVSTIESQDGYCYCFTLDTGMWVARRNGSIFVTGNTGTGKCLAPGTPVVMFDGSVKRVEDIRVGERLLGPDSTPRHVLSLAAGQEEMFRVSQLSGESYTVNRSHILSLRITGLGVTRHGNPKTVTGGDGKSYRSGDIVDISVEDYLKSTSTFKHVAKGWKTGPVEFGSGHDLYIDPYFLGLWLGDGSTDSPSITTDDPEIAGFIRGYAQSLGLRTNVYGEGFRCPTYHLSAGRGRENPLIEEMHSVGLLRGEKFIPEAYLTASVEQRWQLLSGIIDSDGYRDNRGYEVTTKVETLRDGIVRLARSLGLAANSRLSEKRCQTGGGGLYHRICISGDLSPLTVLLDRKRPLLRAGQKDVRLTGISVESVGHGTYHGFEIDGDRRFVLGDFTVTHNTSIAIVSTLYHLYLLSCMKNPQGWYGFPKATSIVFALMGAKPRVVNKVIYLPMRKLVDSMPYFQKHMRPDRLIESEMYFPEKNIRVAQSGGDEDAILGEAIIGGVVDEINFMNVVLRSKKAEVTSGRAGLYDQAEQVFSTMQRRKRGRFTRPGPAIGIVIPSSSTRYRGDFTDKRRQFVQKNELKTAYIYCPKQYEVVPAERFSGRKFKLVIGNDVYHDTRVLRDDEPVPEGAWIEEIPIEYLDDFLNRPYDALRDVLGISNNAISPFIKTRHKVYECVAAGEEMGLSSILVRDHVILGEHGMPQVKQGTYCMNPSRPRYVHIDLSRNADRCVAEGQKVLMADRTQKSIENVREGDMVVTKDGTCMPVVQTHRNGAKGVLEVSVYGWATTLRATGNHMVWAVRRDSVSYADGRLVKPSHPMFSGRSRKAAERRYCYTPVFVRLDSLRPGDFLVTPRPRPTSTVQEVAGVMLGYESGYIAGLFAAEGSYWVDRNQEYVQFSLHKDEVRIVEQLTEHLATVFGVRTRIQPDTRHDGITVRVTKSQRLVDFLLAVVGEYSNRKHLAGAALDNRAFRAGLAHGYVDGDGHVKYSEAGEPVSAKVKTASEAMARQFYWMLVSEGFTPTMGYEDGFTQVEHGREVARRAVYSVAISGAEQMKKFRFWLDGHVDVPCSQAMALPGYVLSPIQDLRDGGTCPVYDLTVANESSYVVGNSVVHNCGIAMLRFDGMRTVQRNNGMAETLPVAVVEMACTITPDVNNEIDVAEVRAFVKHLKDKYGYSIKAVSYDGVDSRESIQQWRKTGMRAAMISVDRSSAPYKQLRDAMYDTRVLLPDDDILLTELIDLEFDEKKDKVDHPVTGTKDLADAVCGAYTNMLERRSTWTAAAADDAMYEESQRAVFDSRFDEPRRP